MTWSRKQRFDEEDRPIREEEEGVSGSQAVGMWLVSAEGFRFLVIVIVLLFVFGVFGCELRVRPG